MDLIEKLTDMVLNDEVSAVQLNHKIKIEIEHLESQTVLYKAKMQKFEEYSKEIEERISKLTDTLPRGYLHDETTEQYHNKQGLLINELEDKLEDGNLKAEKFVINVDAEIENIKNKVALFNAKKKIFDTHKVKIVSNLRRNGLSTEEEIDILISKLCVPIWDDKVTVNDFRTEINKNLLASMQTKTDQPSEPENLSARLGAKRNELSKTMRLPEGIETPSKRLQFSTQPTAPAQILAVAPTTQPTQKNKGH